MLLRRSKDRFDPLEYATPLTTDEMIDFGVKDYSAPTRIRSIDGVHFVKNSFEMADGWKYDTVSTVLSPEQLVTTVAGTMTGGWFTGEYGFNKRRMASLGKAGSEWTFVSVPTNRDRGWGDMKANAYNQARIGRSMARILGRHSLKGPDGMPLGRHPSLSLVDGLSRAGMHGEAVTGVSPEVGADVLFAYYTVACRINGVEEVDDIADIFRALTPQNLARTAMRGEIPQELMLAHILKTVANAGGAINEALGKEFAPFKEFVTTPLEKIRSGESLMDAIGDTIGKFHPSSIAIPYTIMSRYPASIDLRRLDRQILEAYTLTNGTYGDMAEKVSPYQFQVHSGFLPDGLSRFEEIVAAHDPKTHPHTITEAVENGSHATVVIEEKNKAWKNRMSTVIRVIGKIGTEQLESMTPIERWETLHTMAAAENEFFADDQQPYHPPHAPEHPPRIVAA